MRASNLTRVAIAALLTCGGSRESPPSATAVLPRSSISLHPAQTALAGAVSGDTLTETESCASCHAAAAAQWRSSAHAFASFNNPIYRLAVDRFRTAVGNEPSRFCAGCHDVALLVDGAMTGAVEAGDGRGHGGVTCRVCHGIESARPDGNGSYVLSSSPIPIPRDGDFESVRAHKQRMALAPLRTSVMCGSCHRSFLSPDTGNPAHLVGQDELGAWQRSAYAGSFGTRIDERIEPQECRSCHMPLENAPQGDAASRDGKIRSHRFAGAQSWLAAMRGDAAQIDAVGALLRGAASVDVAAIGSANGTATLPADGAPAVTGDALTIDVVVRNERVGHRFPGGVLDAQDTWIEVEVRDAKGRLLAEAGLSQEATGEDRTAHRLRALQVDELGTPLLTRETHRFRTPVFNHTIGPRDAQVVRYRFEVPPLGTPSLPLRVSARLRHRSRDLALASAVCTDAKTPRGIAFVREVRERTGAPMDPCASEPVTDVGESEVWIGEGWRTRTSTTTMAPWRRLLDHGLALLSALQEDVESARPSLERALALSPDGQPRVRAIVLHALAQLAIREGRTDEAMQWLDAAERLLPSEPAIRRARGQAFSDIWLWQQAAIELQGAALAAPRDDALWSQLAIAYASADQPRAALDAAGHGLRLNPRDADMLRVQAIALERLGAPIDEVASARYGFERWRPPDDSPAKKSACSRRFDWCALERIPVHVHSLRTGR